MVPDLLQSNINYVSTNLALHRFQEVGKQYHSSASWNSFEILSIWSRSAYYQVNLGTNFKGQSSHQYFFVKKPGVLNSSWRAVTALSRFDTVLSWSCLLVRNFLVVCYKIISLMWFWQICIFDFMNWRKAFCYPFCLFPPSSCMMPKQGKILSDTYFLNFCLVLSRLMTHSPHLCSSQKSTSSELFLRIVSTLCQIFSHR